MPPFPLASRACVLRIQHSPFSGTGLALPLRGHVALGLRDREGSEMRMLQNGEERSFDPSACLNLAELVETCTRGLDGRTHVVMSVRVNGCEIPEERLGELEGYTLDGIEEVEVASAPSRDVAISSLAHSADYAGRIGAVIERAVYSFRTGDFARGSETCAALSDSIGVLVTAVSAAAAALGRDAEALRGFDSELLPWIESLVNAQSEADWVRVADCLEYEIAPRIENWGRVLQGVRFQEKTRGSA